MKKIIILSAGIFLITFGIIFGFRYLWMLIIDGGDAWRYVCPGCNPQAWEQATMLRDMENPSLFFTIRFLGAGVSFMAGVVGIVFACRIKMKTPSDDVT